MRTAVASMFVLMIAASMTAGQESGSTHFNPVAIF